jgi:tRNA(Ile)-lysidine synthase
VFEKFKYNIKQSCFIAPDKKILLAVSGGIDSMVMLNLFAELRTGAEAGIPTGADFAVAHCNFRLRGEESEGDQRLVESECRRLGVELFVGRFDVAADMAASGDSLQMSARRLRYSWFEGLCRDHGFASVAIAHNADDSTETFFINLLRGTGLKGLTGIPPTRGRIVRPLLFATREMIAHYAAQHGVAFREDSSNRSTKYLRNRIRRFVLPRLREIDPGFTTVMAANFGRLAATESFVERSIELIRGQVEKRDGDAIVIDTAAVAPSLPLDFVLFGLLGRYGFGADVVAQLARALAEGGTGRMFHAPKMTACIDRRRIVLTNYCLPEDKELVIKEFTESARWGGATLRFELVPATKNISFKQPDNVALLDAAKASFPLTVRRWQDGDAFVPLGMRGRKKVSDMLTDLKAPLPDKARQAALVSGERIVWLVGRRIADGAKVTEKTDNILKITVL